MIEGKKIACVIPARLKSTRFPRKMLCKIGGIPLIERVWRQSSRVKVFDEVVFAIDAKETAELIESFGGKWYMTSESCPSGSDRLAELLRTGKIDADVFVNWQGDEPFIQESMVMDLLQSCATEESDLWTLKKRILSEADYLNPHIAKVVCDHKGFALYFSRSPIPFYRDIPDFSKKEVYKHIGMYAYTRDALIKLNSLFLCAIEFAEQLEQLRFLYNGLRIRVHETNQEVFGIDLPEHVQKAEVLLAQNLKN